MINLIISVTLIFSLLILWVLVQQISRKFAGSHPEFGSVKEEGLGCGKNCGCSNKSNCKEKMKFLENSQ